MKRKSDFENSIKNICYKTLPEKIFKSFLRVFNFGDPVCFFDYNISLSNLNVKFLIKKQFHTI